MKRRILMTEKQLEQKKQKAIAALTAEALTKAKRDEAARLEKRAAALWREAAVLADDWKKATKAAAEALEADGDEAAEAYGEKLTAEARALFIAARDARRAALEADEAAEAARAIIDAALAARDDFNDGDDIIVVWYEKTNADLAAEAAAKKAADAAEAFAKAEAVAASHLPIIEAEAVGLAALKADADAAARDAKRARKAAREAAADRRRIAIAIGAKAYAATTPKRPTLPLAFAHAVADRVGTPFADLHHIAAYWNVTKADLILPAARTVARRTCVNSIKRQGTPTQWRLYFAAARGAYDDDADLADLAAEAAAALAVVTATPARRKAEATAAALLIEAAADLRKVAEGDGVTRTRLLNAARRASRKYTADGEADARIIDDAARMKSRGEAAALAARGGDAAARGEVVKAAEALTRAAFLRVNGYLADLRAIRADAAAPALSLEALEASATPAAMEAAELTPYKRIRRETIAAALPAAMEALTKPQAAALKALYRAGGDASAAARLIGRSEKTIRRHKAAITAALAVAIKAIAPNSIEAISADLAAEAAALEADEAAAALEAAKAKAAALRKAAEVREAGKQKAAAALEAAEGRADLAADLAAAVADAVAALPPAMREAAALIGRGASQREAAEALNKSRATIREAAAAAARRIRAAIKSAEVDIDAEALEAADLAALWKFIK